MGGVSVGSPLQLGLRWRTEREVIVGKGQFVCAATDCEQREELRTFEVPFSYVEAGRQKQALVKCRLCPECRWETLHIVVSMCV